MNTTCLRLVDRLVTSSEIFTCVQFYSLSQCPHLFQANIISLQSKHRGYLVKPVNQKDKEFHEWLYAFDPLLAGTLR